MEGPQIHWTGEARWLSFAVAGLLLFLGIMLVAANVGIAGLYIFFGLLLFGAVASGYVHAPGMVKSVGILLAVQLVLSLVTLDLFGITIAGAASVALFFAWRDFERQTAALPTETRERWRI